MRDTAAASGSAPRINPFIAASSQSFGAGVSSSSQPLPKPHPLPDFLPELASS